MDKIKVNLNYKLYHLLIRDMEDFLFYKENKEINKNLFYNTIVIRMYERIIKQYQQKSAQTQEILNKYHIHNLKLRDELVEVSNLLYPIHEDSNVYNESILFRPNKQFLPIFEEIEEKYLFNQSISFFYRNLFTLYANMRQDERERLVFQDSLERIEKCIRLKKGIKIKMNEKEFITELKKLNIDNIQILSGDKQTIVSKLAGYLGVDEAYGDLLPEGKVAHVETLKSDSERRVAFVGDGINDAPVLALSDVGVAMGGLGSDAAIEIADVVLQTDQPSRLAMAIRIGKETRRIIWQNITLAFGVKLIVLILGAGGLATMWEAVFADVGVALLAILNAIRIQRRVR